MLTDRALALVDVAVTLGGRPVLRDIDLVVPEGACVAVMGANGSGKSTLVRAAVGLWPVVHGEVALFGTPLAAFRDWHRLGYVPQRSTAASGVPASVWEVVASGRLTRRRRFRPLGPGDRRAIVSALDAVGLAERRGEGVSTLSGGQQQRVLIARALAGEPDLVVLDEPAAGVDLPNQAALAEALGALRKAGATLVMVTHELGLMQPLIDRSVVMRDGRVAYDGPPLTDQQVHSPHFDAHPAAAGLAGTHTHHHAPAPRPEHALDLRGPFTSERDTGDTPAEHDEAAR